MNRKTARIIGKTFAWSVSGAAVLVLLVLLAFNFPGSVPRQDVSFGVTYSDRYAEALGLDPRAAYLAILDDLGVRKIRLPVYWDRIEPAPGRYDFSTLDWQLSEARTRGAEVILVVGQRVPRWPECFIPSWAEGDDALRQRALIGFITTTVDRYKGDPTVKVWQVENEPFLAGRFGVCPPLDTEFLDREIATVRSLDGRPILLTDSGELSVWYPAAVRGDMFGTTLYRDLYHGRFGYMTYPLGPSFFLLKKWLIETFAHQEHSVVIELQAEPWADGWVADVPLDEQFRTMDEHKLLKNVDYARRLQMPEIYLWGAEWWYWLKEKRDSPAVWDTVKSLFQS